MSYKIPKSNFMPNFTLQQLALALRAIHMPEGVSFYSVGDQTVYEIRNATVPSGELIVYAIAQVDGSYYKNAIEINCYKDSLKEALEHIDEELESFDFFLHCPERLKEAREKLDKNHILDLDGGDLGRSEHVVVRLDRELANRVDEWRAKQTGLPSRDKSARILIARALENDNV